MVFVVPYVNSHKHSNIKSRQALKSTLGNADLHKWTEIIIKGDGKLHVGVKDSGLETTSLDLRRRTKPRRTSERLEEICEEEEDQGRRCEIERMSFETKADGFKFTDTKREEYKQKGL